MGAWTALVQPGFFYCPPNQTTFRQLPNCRFSPNLATIDTWIHVPSKYIGTSKLKGVLEEGRKTSVLLLCSCHWNFCQLGPSASGVNCMLIIAGERPTEEDGSSTAAQHISTAGDRPDAEGGHCCQKHAERPQTGHRRHHHHVREPSWCSRLHVWCKDTSYLETGKYRLDCNVEVAYWMRALGPKLIPVSTQAAGCWSCC